jgi:hypothetical protein
MNYQVLNKFGSTWRVRAARYEGGWHVRLEHKLAFGWYNACSCWTAGNIKDARAEGLRMAEVALGEAQGIVDELGGGKGVAK